MIWKGLVQRLRGDQRYEAAVIILLQQQQLVSVNAREAILEVADDGSLDMAYERAFDIDGLKIIATRKQDEQGDTGGQRNERCRSHRGLGGTLARELRCINEASNSCTPATLGHRGFLRVRPTVLKWSQAA